MNLNDYRSDVQPGLDEQGCATFDIRAGGNKETALTIIVGSIGLILLGAFASSGFIILVGVAYLFGWAFFSSRKKEVRLSLSNEGMREFKQGLFVRWTEIVKVDLHTETTNGLTSSADLTLTVARGSFPQKLRIDVYNLENSPDEILALIDQRRKHALIDQQGKHALLIDQLRELALMPAQPCGDVPTNQRSQAEHEDRIEGPLDRPWESDRSAGGESPPAKGAISNNNESTLEIRAEARNKGLFMLFGSAVCLGLAQFVSKYFLAGSIFFALCGYIMLRDKKVKLVLTSEGLRDLRTDEFVAWRDISGIRLTMKHGEIGDLSSAKLNLTVRRGERTQQLSVDLIDLALSPSEIAELVEKHTNLAL